MKKLIRKKSIFLTTPRTQLTRFNHCVDIVINMTSWIVNVSIIIHSQGISIKIIVRSYSLQCISIERERERKCWNLLLFSRLFLGLIPCCFCLCVRKYARSACRITLSGKIDPSTVSNYYRGLTPAIAGNFVGPEPGCDINYSSCVRSKSRAVCQMSLAPECFPTQPAVSLITFINIDGPREQSTRSVQLFKVRKWNEFYGFKMDNQVEIISTLWSSKIMFLS